MTRALTGILAGVAGMMLAGCGVQGEAYQPRPIPAARSLIYIYRPSAFLSSEADPMITCGHESLELQDGHFYEFVADAESVTCVAVTDAATALKFDAHSGERYFVREDVESGALGSHVRFKLMDPDVAQDEIRNCGRQGITH